jgi:hypothetical protein
VRQDRFHCGGCSCTPLHWCGRCLSHNPAHSRPCRACLWGEPDSTRCWGDLFTSCDPLDNGGSSRRNNKEYGGSAGALWEWRAARPVISHWLGAVWLTGCWMEAWNSREASTAYKAAAAAAALPPAPAAACRPPPVPSAALCCPQRTKRIHPATPDAHAVTQHLTIPPALLLLQGLAPWLPTAERSKWWWRRTAKRRRRGPSSSALAT